MTIVLNGCWPHLLSTHGLSVRSLFKFRKHALDETPTIKGIVAPPYQATEIVVVPLRELHLTRASIAQPRAGQYEAR